jgi:trehalose-phosphatase
MTEYFFSTDGHAEVISILRMRPRILAFDFDGTLAPIAASPADVTISKKLLHLLEKLAEDKNTVTAIVSGRTLADLERMIEIPSIIYYGNHGMTSSVEGFGATREQLLKWTYEASKIHEKISCLESIYKGCIIENKGPVLSVHYRKVDSDKVEELLAKVRNSVAEFNIDLKSGKMVIELKPRTNFTKGTALTEIAEKGFSGWIKGDPFLFAGDDNTDEDGFRIMKNFGENSFSFKIGDGETSANYRLFDGEIEKLIKMII